MGTVKTMRADEESMSSESSNSVRFVMEHSWPAQNFYRTGATVKSAPYIVENSPWYFMMHSQIGTLNTGEATDESLMVFLCRVRPKETQTSHGIHVHAKIGIVGEDNKLMRRASTVLNYVLSKDQDHNRGVGDYSTPFVVPYHVMTSVPYINSRLKTHGLLKVRAEVEYTTSYSDTIEQVESHESFRQSFRDLYESGAGRDFTLVSCDGADKPVHKAILIARSPVFAAMLDCNLIEVQSGRCTIDDITSPVLDILIKHMYCGYSEKDVREHTTEILVAADKYQLTELVRQCEMHLIDELSGENIVDLLLLTDGIATPALKNAALHYIETNAVAMKTSGVMDNLCESGSPALVVEVMKFLSPV